MKKILLCSLPVILCCSLTSFAQQSNYYVNLKNSTGNITAICGLVESTDANRVGTSIPFPPTGESQKLFLKQTSSSLQGAGLSQKVAFCRDRNQGENKSEFSFSSSLTGLETVNLELKCDRTSDKKCQLKIERS